MRRILLATLLLATPVLASPALAEGFEGWPPLLPRFESTGGNGWMIEGYDPVVTGARCLTGFAAISPEGQAFHNDAEFDALPVPGGILCANGRWRAKDGSGSGTTPLRVFIRADGQRFRSP